MNTASPRPVFAALHTVKASEFTQKSSRESKAAFKGYLQIQLSSRSDKRECVVVDYTHVYIGVTCIYNCGTRLTHTVMILASFDLSTCCIAIIIIIVLHYFTLLYTTALIIIAEGSAL